MHQLSITGEDGKSDRAKAAEARAVKKRDAAGRACAKALETTSKALGSYLQACRECNDGSGYVVVAFFRGSIGWRSTWRGIQWPAFIRALALKSERGMVFVCPACLVEFNLIDSKCAELGRINAVRDAAAAATVPLL